MNDTADAYRMNPAEDILLDGDQLADGMWVLAEVPGFRAPYSRQSEDDQMRAQRFRRVSGLRRKPGSAANDDIPQVRFTGTWIDGYAEAHVSGMDMKWIVKKDGGEACEGEQRAGLARAIAAALEEAAIADRDAGDGKVIEIYVSQVRAIVKRVLGEAGQ